MANIFPITGTFNDIRCENPKRMIWAKNPQINVYLLMGPTVFITRLKSKVFSLERLYKFCVKKILGLKRFSKKILMPEKYWLENLFWSQNF